MCLLYYFKFSSLLVSLQEALKKKQQPPVGTPNQVSTVTTTQSLNTLMETAQPTVQCLSTSSLTETSTDVRLFIYIFFFALLINKVVQ